MQEVLSQVREFFRARLRLRGHEIQLSDEESLFLSGRLDSLDVMETILFLENLGVDFSGSDFSVEQIDTVTAVLSLVTANAP